jgi:hypothetical protein
MTIDIATMPERCYTMLKSLSEFESLEVRGIVQGLVATTDRDRCFIGHHHRAVLNVDSLLALNHYRHIQAISMTARSLFELAVDVELIDAIANSIEKIAVFSDVEKLRAAKNILKYQPASSSQSVEAHKSFIVSNAASIEARRAKLWPKVKGALRHWSGLNLSDRAALIKGPLQETYRFEYARLSWYAHGGLTGFVNIDAPTLVLLAANQFWVASDCYCALLTAIIDEFHIEKANPKIKSQLQFARMVPFAPEADLPALKTELLD